MNTVSSGVETIEHGERLLAMIIRREFRQDGVVFFTPGDFSQQLGYMHHPKGHLIPPHVHNPVARAVEYTKEVLFVRSGRVRVDFYSESKDYLRSTVLESGDVILLAFGGHGFEMLEPTEMIEVKQGPYCGEQDKTRFEPIQPDNLTFEASKP